MIEGESATGAQPWLGARCDGVGAREGCMESKVDVCPPSIAQQTKDRNQQRNPRATRTQDRRGRGDSKAGGVGFGCKGEGGRRRVTVPKRANCCGCCCICLRSRCVLHCSTHPGDKEPSRTQAAQQCAGVPRASTTEWRRLTAETPRVGFPSTRAAWPLHPPAPPVWPLVLHQSAGTRAVYNYSL